MIPRCRRSHPRLHGSDAQGRWLQQGSISVHLVLGLLIVMLGLIYLVHNLNIVHLRKPLSYFWAAAFLAIGCALVIERRTPRSWQWGSAWMVAGLWIFAHQQRWIGIGFWELFVPLLMMGGGAYLVHRALRAGHERKPGPQIIEGTTTPLAAAPHDGIIRGVGFLSGSELRPSGQSFERAELFALMGGVKLDLGDVQFVSDTATVQIAACMGGVEIHAPSEWTVISNVMPLLGAFADKRRPAAAGTQPKKTLYVNGFVLMGGVEIKN